MNTPKLKANALSLLAPSIALIYLEAVLKLTAQLPFFSPGTPGTVAAALCAGAIISLICSLPGKTKAGVWLGFGLIEALTVWFLIAYFTDNAYQVFMDASSVFGEAGNVVNGFGDTVLHVLVFGLPVILLYHLPSVLWLVFNRRLDWRGEKKLPQCALLLLCAVVFGVGSYAFSNADEALRAKYNEQYNYDMSVRTFGLLTGTGLDVRHIALGGSVEEEIVFAAPLPAEKFVPEPLEKIEYQPAPQQPAEENPPVLQTEPEEAEPEIEPEAEPEPPDIDYPENILPIDFAALAENESNPYISQVHSYVSTAAASSQNEYTGLFKGKNLILITAEAFTAEIIDPQRTPTLYRLANKGIVFEDFYQPAWGGSTSTGEFSFLMGTIPTTASAIQYTIGHNLYFTLGNQLQREGYFSRAYHNGAVEYYNRHLTHKNLGYSEYIACGNWMEKGLSGGWPASDLEMLQYTLPDYIDEESFSVYYMSVSGHCNYRFSEQINAMSVKNKAAVEGMEYSEKVLAYYAANQELENALSFLVGELEAKGIADDTVIAICADHYPYGLERSMTWNNDRDYLCELYGCDRLTNLTRDHNAGIIWSGCLEDLDEPIVVSAPSYSLDMLPTLSNLFGLEFDSRLLVGRDVLSDAEPLVIWMDYSWLTDKGYYNGADATFTANEGVEVDEDYVARINQTVQNKMAFSKAVLNYDYYGLLFGPDEVN